MPVNDKYGSVPIRRNANPNPNPINPNFGESGRHHKYRDHFYPRDKPT